MLISPNPQWGHLSASVATCIFTPGSHCRFPWLSFEVSDCLMFGTCKHLQMLSFLQGRSSADVIFEIRLYKLLGCFLRVLVFISALSTWRIPSQDWTSFWRQVSCTVWAKWGRLLCVYIFICEDMVLFIYFVPLSSDPDTSRLNISVLIIKYVIIFIKN